MSRLFSAAASALTAAAATAAAATAAAATSAVSGGAVASGAVAGGGAVVGGAVAGGAVAGAVSAVDGGAVAGRAVACGAVAGAVGAVGDFNVVGFERCGQRMFERRQVLLPSQRVVGLRILRIMFQPLRRRRACSGFSGGAHKGPPGLLVRQRIEFQRFVLRLRLRLRLRLGHFVVFEQVAVCVVHGKEEFREQVGIVDGNDFGDALFCF